MFGPYEIELEGRRYFGNVALREFHSFEHEGNTYVIDVQSLSAQAVSPRLAGAINRLAMDPGILVPESLMQTLRGLKLVAGEEDAPPKAESSPKPEAQAKPEFPVVNIGLFLAQECNMRCVYCYGNAGEYGGSGMMDEDTAFRAVDWLVENSGSAKKINIGFFGGEPLLNFALMRKIVPYAKQKAGEAGKDMGFAMTTNGSLLTDEVIAFIREEKIEAMISFDGPPEVQNRQRPFKDGSGSYDTVVANVQKLREVLPRLMARATVCDDGDPVLIKQGMEQAGFAACYLAPASPVLLNGSETGEPADGSGQRRLERMLAVHRQEAGELLGAIRERKIAKDCPPAALGAMDGLATGQKRYHGCGIGKGMAGITVNGDVYPCHRFAGLPEMRLGNIADYKAGALNDYHRAIVDSLPECRTCWARYLCGGGCFYHNKATTGDMRRPGAFDCREKKAMFEGLIHVHCQLDEAEREYVKEIIKGLSLDDRHP